METFNNFLATVKLILANPFVIYGTILFFFTIVIRNKNIKTLRIGSWIIFEGQTSDGKIAPSSIINARDVKQYHQILQLLIYNPTGILSDIRYRVVKNGWEKRTDWEQYIADAIQQHRNTMTEFLNLHYPEEALVDRIELFEENKALVRKTTEKYERMYCMMYDIFKEAYDKANKLRKELDQPVFCTLSFRDTNDTKVCLTIPKVIQVVNEIQELEGITTRERCMNEAERVIKDIMQSYYSLYLTIYSEKKKSKAKKGGK
jgi:hypothetical protein